MLLKVCALCAFSVLACFISCTEGISVERDLSLTLHQKNALDKFRERVRPLLTEDYQKHDIYIIRWLRARNFDLNAAEMMLRQNLRWRKERNMKGILQEDFSDMEKDYPQTMDTYDKEGKLSDKEPYMIECMENKSEVTSKGRPIGTIDIYEWDIRRAAVQGKGQRLLRYMNYLMENVTMQVFERQAKGMNVTQWKVLGSADGFNVIEHACPLCIPLWVQFVQSLEMNYNGWLDELLVIDAPSSISIILDAIKPFLTQQTRDAFRIFSANRSKWLPYLDQRIAKEERRPQYGGTKPPVVY